MAVERCIRFGDLPALPSIEIPQFGILSAIRKDLYSIPDINPYLLDMQAQIQLAIAPLRRFFELIEIILAIRDCQKAVIDALLPPSPGPIIECLRNLIRALARLAAFFPPLEYVKTLVTMCIYSVAFIDAVWDLFGLLDARISELKAGLAEAIRLGDLDLAAIYDCASTEVTALINQSLDPLQIVLVPIQMMLDPIARLVPIKPLQDALSEIVNITAEFEQLRSDGFQTARAEVSEFTVELPLLQPLLDITAKIRNVIVIVHNTAAPVVGRDPDLGTRQAPQLENL